MIALSFWSYKSHIFLNQRTSILSCSPCLKKQKIITRQTQTESKTNSIELGLLKPSLANSSPLTPLGFLDTAATIHGDIPSVIYNDTTYTWSQTRRHCLQLVSALSSLGICSGDIVSVIAPNIPAMYELQFSVPFVGAILNNINTRLDARTISIILRHAESKLVDLYGLRLM